MKNFLSNIKYRLILKIIFTRVYDASTVIRSSESGVGGGGGGGMLRRKNRLDVFWVRFLA